MDRDASVPHRRIQNFLREATGVNFGSIGFEGRRRNRFRYTSIAVVDFDLGGIGRRLCDAAFQGVIEQLLQGYLVVGGTFAGQAGLYRQSYGMDFVWDLWNEQFSAFTYPEHALSTDSLAGGAGGVHLGAGFGRFDSVHDAWSGTFLSSEVSIDARLFSIVRVNGMVQGFTSPDGRMVGGLVGAGASVSIPSSVSRLVRLPLGATVTPGGGVWTPSNELTRALTPASRQADLSTGRYTYLNLEEGEFGVASHMVHVLGPTPTALLFSNYAIAVAMVKRHMEDKGFTETADRSAGLRDLHLTLCSQAYRRIQAYSAAVPSGDEEQHNDGYSIQRTTAGNYIITTTHSVPTTGEWRSTRRLHRPDGSVISTYRYGMAIGGAPSGLVDGRSLATGGPFETEVGRRLELMQGR